MSSLLDFIFIMLSTPLRPSKNASRRYHLPIVFTLAVQLSNANYRSSLRSPSKVNIVWIPRARRKMPFAVFVFPMPNLVQFLRLVLRFNFLNLIQDPGCLFWFFVLISHAVPRHATLLSSRQNVRQFFSYFFAKILNSWYAAVFAEAKPPILSTLDLHTLTFPSTPKWLGFRG